MKATLEFDLPEDVESFRLASNASLYNTAIDDIFNILRNHIKYQNHSEQVIAVLHEIRDEILQTIPEECK